MIHTIVHTMLLAALLTPAAVYAQDRRPEQALPSNATPNRPAEEQAGSPSTNIQVEITIADYLGTGAPQKKTVSVIVADGYMGRIRSARSATSPTLNVDATPKLLDNGRISLRLILEYSPPVPEKSMNRGSPINQSVTVTLQSGKPLVISQGADPSMDRKVTVEVNATVLK